MGCRRGRASLRFLFAGSDFELRPDSVYALLRGGVHLDFIGPAAGETLLGPFSRRVDAHFRTEILPASGVVQRVHRTECEADVTFRIDRAQRFPYHFARVLHVDVVIDNYYDLREHRLPERPDRVHRLTRVARVAFADGHNHQILKNSLRRHRHVHDFRMLHLHHRQEHALDHVADEIVLLRRRAHDGRQVDWLFAVRDAIDVEDRIGPFQRIKTGVIAERTFRAHFAEIDVALENDFRIGGNFQIHRLAGDQLDRIVAQGAGG